MAAAALDPLALIAGQPWVWAPITIAAILARDVIRLLAFLWGLSIALRGTSGRHRAHVLTAYAACLAGTRARRSAGPPVSDASAQ